MDWTTVIDGCRKGDRKCQAEAYRSVWKTVFPALYRLLRDRGEAEDVMQEGILRGFDRLRELQTPDRYPAWQKRICLNMALNRLRVKKGKLLTLEEISTTEDHVQVDTDIPEDFNVFAYVDQLPDGYRTILLLFLMEGYSHEEIGAQLNISASTSRSQYSRALQKLKSNVLETYEKQI
ncbi:MAG: sigma-70 family RNA polymerase sigma factor [Flavobacteriales bacterium]|nr:sigma-70 family RNA polymerase sigma factor [Flavobacteriales bacterium]